MAARKSARNYTDHPEPVNPQPGTYRPSPTSLPTPAVLWPRPASQPQCGLTFSIHFGDIEMCPLCRERLRVIASIEGPALIAKVLGQVQNRDERAGPAARAPPGVQALALKLG